jgi:hypothetical protein
MVGRRRDSRTFTPGIWTSSRPPLPPNGVRLICSTRRRKVLTLEPIAIVFQLRRTRTERSDPPLTVTPMRIG